MTSKLIVIVVAFAILAMASVACNDITPGDGQVADAVEDADAAIRNTATDVKEFVESTGESSVEIPTEHGTVVIDTVWKLALSIAKGE